jgi:hypothetical protein
MRTLCSLVVVALLLVMSAAVLAHTEENPLTVDLIAGNPKNTVNVVGVVKVWNDDVNLYVKYEITVAPWVLTGTHLHIAANADDVPQKNGNPIPGKFEYKGKPDKGSPEYILHTIPLGDEGLAPGDDIAIAAHAEVCGYDIMNDPLPSPVSIRPFRSDIQIGEVTYFEIEVTGGSFLNGKLDGYCVDTDNGINLNVDYTGNVYSSYGILPAGLVDIPENLDLLNWLINQHYVGQDSPGGHGVYTFGDVQKAIWELVEDAIPQAALDSLGIEGVDWKQDRVDEIVAAAEANGEGFVPGCGDLIAIIIEPLPEGKVQIVIVLIPLICGCETAWGEGPGFPGKNWAMYFNYEVQGPSGAPPSMSSRSSVTTTWGSIKDR